MTKDHSHCTNHACVADNIDESTYASKHLSAVCDCAHVGEDCGASAQVARILHSSSIPVIQISQAQGDRTADIIISVKESFKAPYVAISHVWSDGLGNPRNNTLPQCQLSRLQDCVNILYPESSHPVPFWIDTICVPRQMRLRKTAIRFMGQTYKAADKVLVIDAWLTETGLAGNERLDLLKIKSSNWTQRLWTLQECLLSQQGQLCFLTPEGPIAEGDIFGNDEMFQGIEFMSNLIGSEHDILYESYPNVATAMIRAIERIKDIYTKIDEIRPAYYSAYLPSSDPHFPWAEDYHMLNEVDSWYMHDFVWAEGRDYLKDMRWPGGGIPSDVPILEANLLTKVGYSMRFRATSKIEDEPVCFATLLGQDPKDLLEKSSVQERMELVFSKMKHVPIMILFLPTPRIDVNGLRWAPLSFRTHSIDKAYSPGLTFTELGERRQQGLLVKLEAIALELTDFQHTRSQFLIKVGSGRLFVKTRMNITNHGFLTNTNLALIVRSGTAALSHTRGDAVLVARERTEGDSIFARLLSLCFVGPPAPRRTNASQIMLGRIVPKQQWCIG